MFVVNQRAHETGPGTLGVGIISTSGNGNGGNCKNSAKFSDAKLLAVASGEPVGELARVLSPLSCTGDRESSGRNWRAGASCTHSF